MPYFPVCFAARPSTLCGGDSRAPHSEKLEGQDNENQAWKGSVTWAQGKVFSHPFVNWLTAARQHLAQPGFPSEALSPDPLLGSDSPTPSVALCMWLPGAMKSRWLFLPGGLLLATTAAPSVQSLCCCRTLAPLYVLLSSDSRLPLPGTLLKTLLNCSTPACKPSLSVMGGKKSKTQKAKVNPVCVM